jgi:hypothetical protein
MARTLPGGGGERAVLAGAHINVYAKLEIQDSDGTWRDLTNLSGQDWLDRWTVDESVDDPVARASFVLRREIGALSLAPMMQTSLINRNAALAYVPLLTPPNLMRLSTATVANGVAPIAGNYHEIFRGPITNVDPSNPDDGITVQCLDQGHLLQNVMIEEERQYSTSGGSPVQNVMQDIMDDWLPTAFSLITPVSPGWDITKYTQAKVNVLQAISDLAAQIGWDIRYVYQAATDIAELRFFQPDRTRAVADWTFGPDEYTRLPMSDVNDLDVRNAARVNYVDATGTKQTVLRESLTSIAIFGRRYMEITEDDSSNIDTAVEANAMGDAAIADLGIPIMEHQIETLHFWPLQLNDLCTFLANGVQYSADQTLAAIAFRHDGAGGHATTTISCRGKPAGAYRKWLRKSKVSGKPKDPQTPATPPIAEVILVGPGDRTTQTVRLTAAAVDARMYPIKYQTKLGHADWSALTTSDVALDADYVVHRKKGHALPVHLRVVQRDGQAATAQISVSQIPADEHEHKPKEEKHNHGDGGVPAAGKGFSAKTLTNFDGSVPTYDPVLGGVTPDMRAADGVKGIESTRGSRSKSDRAAPASLGRENQTRGGEGGVPTALARYYRGVIYDPTGVTPLLDTVAKSILSGLAIGAGVRGDSSVVFGSATKYPTFRHAEEIIAVDGDSKTFGVSYESVPVISIRPDIYTLPGTSSTVDRKVEVRATNVTVSGFSVVAQQSTGSTRSAQSENPAATLNGTPNAGGIDLSAENDAAFFNLAGANSTLTTYKVTYNVDTSGLTSGLLRVRIYKNAGTGSTSWTQVSSRAYDAGLVLTGEVQSFDAAMALNWDIRILLDYTSGSGASVHASTATYDKIVAGTATTLTPAGSQLTVQAREAA